MRLRASVRKFLELERVCHVATADRNGAPHAVPVCHVVVDGKIYFATDKDSRKARNLRANPKLAVAAALYSEDWPRLAGVLVQGRAKFIARGPQFRKIRALLYRKYPQYPREAALEEGEVVMVELSPASVSSWGLE
jgi:PPOX class probable F420-dependent enzyme